jgi:hypothetical protein
VRRAVLAVLGCWVAGGVGPDATRLADGAGVLVRLPLREAEAVALLRDLYATGLAPAGVILRPVGPRGAPGPEPAAPSLELFARHRGRFVPTWNWRAFVFGPLWYLRRGLYGKGLVLLGLSVCPFFGLAGTLLVSVAVLVYCGVAGNWDDYLWRARGRQWW